MESFKLMTPQWCWGYLAHHSSCRCVQSALVEQIPTAKKIEKLFKKNIWFLISNKINFLHLLTEGIPRTGVFTGPKKRDNLLSE